MEKRGRAGRLARPPGPNNLKWGNNNRYNNNKKYRKGSGGRRDGTPTPALDQSVMPESWDPIPETATSKPPTPKPKLQPQTRPKPQSRNPEPPHRIQETLCAVMCDSWARALRPGSRRASGFCARVLGNLRSLRFALRGFGSSASHTPTLGERLLSIFRERLLSISLSR